MTVNDNHRQLCPSPEWAAYLQGEVLPPLMRLVELGDDMLEIGPGPGAATDWLRHRVKRLTVLEIDPDAAALLTKRFDVAGSNVEVVVGDATAMDFDSATFSSVGTFTMLHHVPTAALQRALLAEALRVLAPGGVLVGSDSAASTELHEFHAGDTYNPIDPARLLVLLQGVGFGRVSVTVDHAVTFVAEKPDESRPDWRERDETGEE